MGLVGAGQGAGEESARLERPLDRLAGLDWSRRDLAHCVDQLREGPNDVRPRTIRT